MLIVSNFLRISVAFHQNGKTAVNHFLADKFSIYCLFQYKTKQKSPHEKILYQNIHKWLDEKGRVYVHTYHDTSLYIKSKLQFLKKKWWHQAKHEKNGEQSKILSAVKFITRAQIEMRNFSLSCAFSWVWRLSSRCRIIFIESILKWANIKTHIHYTYVRT